MVGNIINLIGDLFSTVLAWFWQIMIAIDGLDWVLAALIFVAVVSLLLMPLRGGRSIDTSPLADASVSFRSSVRPYTGKQIRRQTPRISRRGNPELGDGTKRLGTGGYKVK